MLRVFSMIYCEETGELIVNNDLIKFFEKNILRRIMKCWRTERDCACIESCLGRGSCCCAQCYQFKEWLEAFLKVKIVKIRCFKEVHI